MEVDNYNYPNKTRRGVLEVARAKLDNQTWRTSCSKLPVSANRRWVLQQVKSLTLITTTAAALLKTPFPPPPIIAAATFAPRNFLNMSAAGGRALTSHPITFNLNSSRASQVELVRAPPSRAKKSERGVDRACMYTYMSRSRRGIKLARVGVSRERASER